MHPPNAKAGGTFAAAGPNTNFTHSLIATTSLIKPDAEPMTVSRGEGAHRFCDRPQGEPLSIVEKLRALRSKRRARR
jgi:hypothetical protein